MSAPEIIYAVGGQVITIPWYAVGPDGDGAVS